jgi:hypothetical protein
MRPTGCPTPRTAASGRQADRPQGRTGRASPRDRDQHRTGGGASKPCPAPVPRSLSVRVTSGTGSISLASLSGQLRAYADVGNIHGEGLADTLAELRTDVGSIDATFTSAPAQLDANADTGSVRLPVPPGPGYHTTTSADVGSVSVSVRQDSSSGHAIQASADVGSVTIAAS